MLPVVWQNSAKQLISKLNCTVTFDIKKGNKNESTLVVPSWCNF